MVSKKINRRLFLKSSAYAGFGILATQFTGCKGDDDITEEKPKTPTVPKIEIIPEPGMNLYGAIIDTDGNPIKGVVVSDGRNCVATNEKGIYQMKKATGADMIFYSTPAEYTVKVAGSVVNVATFWTPIVMSTQRYDFTLKKLAKVETEFTLICIGDPQVTSQADVDRFKTETMNDLKTFLVTQKKPCYGLVMGDVVGDQPTFFSQMRTAMGATSMPYFTTIGNHDHNKGITNDDANAGNAFKEVFGPLNYSFNRGDVHFVCLDDVLYKGQSDYTAGFTNEQIDWLRQDLSFVPKNKMIIVYYHIPLRNTTSYANRAAMLNLLKDFANVQLMAGHTHYAENFNVTTTLSTYEHIHAAACGAWWKSTLNVDGAPNGYAVYDVKGTELTNWFYKATNYPKEFQIRLHKGNTSFGGQYGYFTYNKGTNIVANIWNADSNWKIEAYEDDQYAGDLVKQSTMIDAFAAGYHVGILNRDPNNYGATGSGTNKHAYLHTIKNTNAKVIEIRATDPFGTVYKQSEIISNLSTASGY